MITRRFPLPWSIEEHAESSREAPAADQTDDPAADAGAILIALFGPASR